MSNGPANEDPRPLEPGLDPERDRDEVLRLELEHRLRIFEELDDDAFGRFTRLDWFVCSALFFVIPLLIAWLAA